MDVTANLEEKSSQDYHLDEGTFVISRQNIHACPSCGLLSLKGMPGGVDAHCENCGFKEPCCGD